MSLSATSRSGSITLFATVIGAPVGITSTSVSLAFCISDRITKNCKKWEKRKRNLKIILFARNKLNSIENKISKVLNNSEINHEELRNYGWRKKYELTQEGNVE